MMQQHHLRPGGQRRQGLDAQAAHMEQRQHRVPGSVSCVAAWRRAHVGPQLSWCARRLWRAGGARGVDQQRRARFRRRPQRVASAGVAVQGLHRMGPPRRGAMALGQRLRLRPASAASCSNAACNPSTASHTRVAQPKVQRHQNARPCASASSSATWSIWFRGPARPTRSPPPRLLVSQAGQRQLPLQGLASQRIERPSKSHCAMAPVRGSVVRGNRSVRRAGTGTGRSGADSHLPNFTVGSTVFGAMGRVSTVRCPTGGCRHTSPHATHS